MYNSLGKFYKQNQAAAVGDVLSQLEPVIEGENKYLQIRHFLQPKSTVVLTFSQKDMLWVLILKCLAKALLMSESTSNEYHIV